MGKHSSTSMKRFIENEYKIVRNILNVSTLSPQRKEEVLDTYKELAYRWCSADAMNHVLTQFLIENGFSEKQIPNTLGSSTYLEKMKETFPFFTMEEDNEA